MQRIINVTALTSGKHLPSSRFRVRQFIRPLRSLGINVSEYYPLLNKYQLKPLPVLGMLSRVPGIIMTRRSDITWFERELVPGRLTLETRSKGKRLLDVDDAIWLNAPHFSEKLAQICDGVIAGNAFISDYYSRLGVRSWTIPTSIDTDTWRPASRNGRQKWTIGWTGTSSNLKYLYSVEEPLADFLAEHPESELLVICNRKPRFKKLPMGSWRFLRWTMRDEIKAVQAMDVGLMPLTNDEWTRGKCALKMITYMAIGIPTIASSLGVAEELLRDHEVGFAARNANDWYSSLKIAFEDEALAKNMGLKGRRLAEKEFSVIANAPKLAAVMREVADPSAG